MGKDVLIGIAGQGSKEYQSPTPEVSLIEDALANFERARELLPGLTPKVILPISFGLYAGMVISGAAGLSLVIKLANERANLVREAEAERERKGLERTGMLVVVGKRIGDLQQLIERYELKHTNNNGPLAHVFAQTLPVLERVRAEILDDKRTKILLVEGAYHCEQYRATEMEIYSKVVMGAKIGYPKIPIISSTSPRLLETGADIKSELVDQLCRQVDLPEAFSLLTKVSDGVNNMVDIGPTAMVTRFGRRISHLRIVSVEENPDQVSTLVS